MLAIYEASLRLCDCASCGKLLIGERSWEKTSRRDQTFLRSRFGEWEYPSGLVAERVSGRPRCGECSSIESVFSSVSPEAVVRLEVAQLVYESTLRWGVSSRSYDPSIPDSWDDAVRAYEDCWPDDEG